ncbi:Anoctamin/TMEM 16 [Aphelenchoides avenae]|nr:Anoctamin/TMEM 16 [Aphelenchus avenae]
MRQEGEPPDTSPSRPIRQPSIDEDHPTELHDIHLKLHPASGETDNLLSPSSEECRAQKQSRLMEWLRGIHRRRPEKQEDAENAQVMPGENGYSLPQSPVPKLRLETAQPDGLMRDSSLDSDGGQRPSSKRQTYPPIPLGPSRYFSDGKRLIDYVLSYNVDDFDDEADADSDEEDPPSTSRSQSIPRRSEKRRVFEANLQKLGLELEYAAARYSNTRFVLVHAPFKVLMKQAELMKVKMPVYQNDVRKPMNLMDGVLNVFLRRFKFLDDFDDKVKKRIDPPDYFTQPFIEQHADCFINYENPEEFFPRSERSRMVYDLLIRTRYDRSEFREKFRFGIERLVKNKSYLAAFPLHDEIDYSAEQVDPETCPERQLLYETWVKMKNVWKYQPLHLIKSYFGTKIGFYFAWLGFYTRFLYIISVVGVFCVFFGVSTMSTDIPSNDVCGSDGVGNTIVVCPVCDTYCDFTPLNSSCVYAKLTYVFDNWSTIFFAATMSVWATLFLEGWKRYHAQLAYKWNVFDFEAEEEMMRPEFQFRRKKFRVNPVTQQQEPYVPLTEKTMRILGSSVTVLFFILLVVALVVGVVVYRVIALHLFYKWEGSIFKTHAVILTSISAACINLIFILIMNYFYSILALKLTAWECPRTQTEFDNSYTLKVFFFQFVNYYSSLVYIAFIKGRLSGVPGGHDREQHVSIGEWRLEGCDPAGCMVELVIQLFIIMCGKQFFNAFMEIAYPVIVHWFRRWRLQLPETKKQRMERIRQENHDAIEAKPEGVSLFERDFTLNGVAEQFLFDEYLEMVIQFGFVTLFVAAFPLAPLFALLNNILEIRLDAYKFVVTTRKPMPEQARNIGIWMTILDFLSNLSVLCNAFVIAFTSDFIPKLYYLVTNNFSLVGYINESLSYFDARTLYNDASSHYTYSGDVCRFRDYRKWPCSLNGTLNLDDECDEDNMYGYSYKFWVILTFRLVFVLVFEHVVLSIKAIFAYVIPDVPTKIVIQLQRERYLARQAVLQRSDMMSQKRRPESADGSTPPTTEYVP